MLVGKSNISFAYRREEDREESLESPAKRMRLSAEEEAGPCDSADGATPLQVEMSPSAICSVADPGCLSRIPDPDFYPSRIRIPDPGSRIPDPKTATKERGEKKLVVIPVPFYLASNFTKL